MSSAANASTPRKKRASSPVMIIFLTVFIDLVGFGIIIPTIPFIAKNYGASGLQLGLLLSVYSFTQFLFSPFWGSLSDRIGRRPTLLMTLGGGALAYFVFAFSQSLTMLFVARALAGAFGGNISTAHAYIGDVTAKEDRSKAMGLIGAAFGLGFVFGPILGGGLGLLGQQLGQTAPWGLNFPALVVGFMCLGNMIFAASKLKESLSPELRERAKSEHGSSTRGGRWQMLAQQLRRPIAGPLMVVFFLSGVAMAQMEAMLIPYMEKIYGWELKQTTYGFAYIGIIMLVTQGYLVRKWMPKFGEARVLFIGLVLFAIGLVGIAVVGNIPMMAVTMTFLALGNGMMRPPNLGMISIATPPEQQGVTMGVTNSLASLGRILGPALGGVLYDAVSPGLPFLSAGLFAAMALIMVYAIYGELPRGAEVKSS